ncbi:MAG: ATP-binding cassette domain-containing protein, partial [Kiritimatiellae bacterium]|nr:ATP-binding cassette domain-containing protein [Kiritimatiellia bacterium]
MRKVLFTRSEHSLKEQCEELEQKISGNTANVSGFIVSACSEMPPMLIGLIISTIYMFWGSDWLFQSGGILHDAPDWLLNAFSGEKQLTGNWYMASFVLFVSFLCMALRWLIDKNTGKRNREDTSKAAEHATFIAMESLRGIQDIRSSNSFPFALKRLSEAKIDAEQKRMKEFRHNQIFGFFSGSFIKCLIESTLVFCAACIICNAFKINMPLTFSDYMGFATSFGIFMGYLVQIQQTIERIPQISADYGVLKDIDALPDIFSPKIGIVPEAKSTTLRFSSVRFQYPTTETQVLDGIDLEVRAGEHVALVGPSGCGKSTLLKLAMRHLTPTGGSVELGGMDIQKINFPYYAKHVTYVSQSPFIFQGTIRDNILVGRDLGLDDDTLIKLLEDVALADDLKRKTPDMHKALDLEIKSGGQSISGGQMAKIALARAIAGNPDILLLDEVTAAFDELSQDHVMKVLATKYRDKTIISINHRLSAVRNMDRIIVMESGKIVQEGKYDELAAKPGLFAALVARESGNVETDVYQLKKPIDDERGLAQALSMSPIFSSLDYEQLANLAKNSMTIRHGKDTFILRKGDAGENLFVVKSGKIEINGRQFTNGYVFGEVALFGEVRRTADVKAIEDTELIEMSRDDIISICRKNPEVPIKILQ